MIGCVKCKATEIKPMPQNKDTLVKLQCERMRYACRSLNNE